MNKTLVTLRFTTCCLLFLTITAFAAEPKLTLHLPFDGNITPKVAAGKAPITYDLKDQKPQFAPGISGQGFVNGANNQGLTFDTAGYLSPDQWTISFWMKGLPNAGWNGSKYFETFWELQGENGGMMYFYHYMKRGAPWLYSRKDRNEDYHHLYAPAAPEKEWHYWAVTWRKGSGAYLYLDGKLVGQSPTAPPDPVTSMTIGQSSNPNSPTEANRIIDEFKIYDTALDAGSIAQRYWQEGRTALKPQISVAPTQHKITIDGNIDVQEWQGAAGYAGMIDGKTSQVQNPQSWGKVTYDNTNLYVAMHSDNPAEVVNDPDTTVLHGYVKKDAIKHDSDVKDDDNFLISLSPQSADEKSYQIRVNGINTVSDAIVNKDGKSDISWGSDATVKSAVGIKGWSMEAAIPLKSLGISALKDGASWNVNFGRVWKILLQRNDLWAPQNSGTLTFAGNDAAADLTKFDVAQDGQIDTALTLTNTTSTAQTLEATLTVADKTIQTKKVLLKPQQSQKVLLDASAQDANGALATVTVKSDTKVLLSQSQPIILQRVGQLALWNYPSLQQIRLGWEILSSAKPQNLSLNAELQSNGKTLKTINLPQLPALKGSHLIDVKELKPAGYTLDVEVKDGAKVVQKQSLTYDKKPLPSWLGNTYGISETPPAPWTDVKVNKPKDAIGIWGRDYDYGNKMFPTQIVNQGKNMLAAPMRLVVNSQSSADQNSTNQWTKTTPIRATSVRSQTMKGLKVSSDSYVEFDGMNWTKLTITPQNGKVLLDGLTLEIPLKSEWAKLIKPHNDYRLKNTGKLSAKGWKDDASAMPWVGNGDGGIQFFQESTARWIGSKTIEVVPGPNGQTMIKVHFVDAKTTLDKPLELNFGWITSPVKPAPKNHRDWRLFSAGVIRSNADGAAYLRQAIKTNPKIQAYFPWAQGWWHVRSDFKGNPDNSGTLPVPKEGLSKDYGISDFDGIKIPSAAYSRLTGQVGTNNPWFAQFGDEWVPNTSKFKPDTTRKEGRQATIVSQSSRSLRDFYLWGFHQLLTQTKTKALYFDVSRIYPDTNIYHGAGISMPDGSIAPTTNILGLRKVFMRIYTQMKTLHPDGKIFYHMSGKPLLPVDSFTDALVDGENYQGLLDRKDNRGYEKTLTVDQFRAEYSAQNNYGPVSVILPQFGRAESMLPEDWKTMGYQHADYLLGLIFLHNSNLWWAYMPYDHLAKVYTAIDSSGWNSDWTFIPYWNQKYFSLPDGVYASLYQSPDDGKVLMVLMNTSGKDQDINLPMTLGKSTYMAPRAIYPDQKLNAQNGKTGTIHIANNDFSSVLLQK